MSANLRKRRGNASDAIVAKKQARALARCPNCQHHVGGTDFIMCSKCDARVHLLCTQLTTDDAVNCSAAFTGFLCQYCSPSSYDNAVDDGVATEMDAEATPGTPSVNNSDSLLRTILKEVQALRSSDRALRQEIAALNARVEELTMELKGVAAKSAPSNRGRVAMRRTTSRQRSTSSARSASSVSFARHRVPRTRERPTVLKPFSGVNDRRKQRSAGRVLRVGLTDVPSVFNAPLTSTQQTSTQQATNNSSLLPVARFQLRHKDLFVAGLDNSITATRVHAHLKENGITALCVKKVEPRYGAHTSFIITVANIDYAKLFDERLWAKGTLVKDYKARGAGPRITESFPTHS